MEAMARAAFSRAAASFLLVRFFFRASKDLEEGEVSGVNEEVMVVEGAYLEGTSWSSMRPLMKEARAAAASLMPADSLEMVSCCMSSSRTLTD